MREEGVGMLPRQTRSLQRQWPSRSFPGGWHLHARPAEQEIYLSHTLSFYPFCHPSHAFSYSLHYHFHTGPKSLKLQSSKGSVQRVA